MTFRSGRHFLQIPGPTNVPDRVLRAIDRPIIDHRGPEFVALTENLLKRLKAIFKTSGPVLVFPASGSGGWEAALVNTLSPGDHVLMFDQGFFANGWKSVAERHELQVDVIPHDWRCAVDANQLAEKLAADKEHIYRAVLIVHNETSTGVASDIASVREALNHVGHPALLMVDTVSSLASMNYCHDAWGVDVAVGGSQKGLMLPPGLGFNAVSEKALEANGTAKLPRSYWDWQLMLEANEVGFFPYTPATNLIYGLRESLDMLAEEGFNNVFARHARLGEATRRAVTAWGLEIYPVEPEAASNSVTTVLVPEGCDSDALRSVILDRFDMSLGTGLGKLKGKVFRIGHLGDFNELMLAGTLCGVEMGLAAAGVPFQPGGVQAALEYLGT